MPICEFENVFLAVKKENFQLSALELFTQKK